MRLDSARLRQNPVPGPEAAPVRRKGTLAARQVELAAAKEGISEETRRHRIEAAHGSLRVRIERFFGLAGGAAEVERDGR